MRRALRLAAGLSLAVALALPAMAAGPEAEIDALIGALAGSNCEFRRNGTWHGAARAQAHLQRKYDWLRKRGLAGTPELFIERAATRSSASGQAYRVRCPGQPETSSAEWFGDRLRRLREAES